jgi:hypothetical protein
MRPTNIPVRFSSHRVGGGRGRTRSSDSLNGIFKFGIRLWSRSQCGPNQSLYQILLHELIWRLVKNITKKKVN